MKYEGKVVLITGASSGIGEGLARKFHSLGAKVIIVARRKERLEALAHELCIKKEGSAIAIVSDISTIGPKGIDSVVQYCQKEHIDILVNNAGRGSFGDFDALNIDKEAELVSLNILGNLKLTHAVIPQMKKRRSGWIINVSSIAGIQPVPFMSTYSATKAFNLHHSFALREELSPFGIRVIIVCPGPVATEFGAAAEVPGGMNLVFASSVDTVVKSTISALNSTSVLITPGFQATLLAFASRLVPKRLSTWITRKLMGR